MLFELEAIDQLRGKEVDVARLVDADLTEHLPDDDLDVLVVDRDALAPVDLLDFLDQVALDGILAPRVEVFLRVDRAVGDRVAGPDLLAALDLQLGVVRDDVLALDDILGPDDDRASAAPVAVVSHLFWVDRLHSDPAAIGSQVIVNSVAFTIVGVTPREFFGERVRRPPDFWIPLALQPRVQLRPSDLERTESYWLSLIARLSPGATRRGAQAAATASLSAQSLNLQLLPQNAWTLHPLVDGCTPAPSPPDPVI